MANGSLRSLCRVMRASGSNVAIGGEICDLSMCFSRIDRFASGGAWQPRFRCLRTNRYMHAAMSREPTAMATLIATRTTGCALMEGICGEISSEVMRG